MKRLIIIAVMVLARAMVGTADAKHKKHGHWKKPQATGKLLDPPIWDCVVTPEDLTTCLPLFPPAPPV